MPSSTEGSAATSPNQAVQREIILASASPRRRELLGHLGLEFRVAPSDVDETPLVQAMRDPERLVAALAEAKAMPVARMHPGALVIGADTIVVLDGEILGKPVDARQARAMLERLAGRTHRVYTGVAIVEGGSGRAEVGVESTAVTFGPMTPETIERYVRTGEPLDKAGAYGIQGLGATLVERVEGCYFNVVGLPLFRLARMLEAFGVRIL